MGRLAPVPFSRATRLGRFASFAEDLNGNALAFQHRLQVLDGGGFIARRIAGVQPHQGLEMF